MDNNLSAATAAQQQNSVYGVKYTSMRLGQVHGQWCANWYSRLIILPVDGQRTVQFKDKLTLSLLFDTFMRFLKVQFYRVRFTADPLTTTLFFLQRNILLEWVKCIVNSIDGKYYSHTLKRSNLFQLNPITRITYILPPRLNKLCRPVDLEEPAACDMLLVFCHFKL